MWYGRNDFFTIGTNSSKFRNGWKEVARWWRGKEFVTGELFMWRWDGNNMGTEISSGKGRESSNGRATDGNSKGRYYHCPVPVPAFFNVATFATQSPAKSSSP